MPSHSDAVHSVGGSPVESPAVSSVVASTVHSAVDTPAGITADRLVVDRAVCSPAESPAGSGAGTNAGAHDAPGRSAIGAVAIIPCGPCVRAKKTCVRATAGQCELCKAQHNTCNIDGRAPHTQSTPGSGSTTAPKPKRKRPTLAEQREQLSTWRKKVQAIRAQLERTTDRATNRVHDKEHPITARELAILMEDMTEDLAEQLTSVSKMLQNARDRL